MSSHESRAWDKHRYFVILFGRRAYGARVKEWGDREKEEEKDSKRGNTELIIIMSNWSSIPFGNIWYILLHVHKIFVGSVGSWGLYLTTLDFYCSLSPYLCPASVLSPAPWWHNCKWAMNDCLCCLEKDLWKSSAFQWRVPYSCNKTQRWPDAGHHNVYYSHTQNRLVLKSTYHH